MAKTALDQYAKNKANKRLLQQERAIYEITELIESALAKKRVSRSKLAKLLGRTPGWVTQLLDGEGNKTIRTVADVFAVLDLEFYGAYRPIAFDRVIALETNGRGTSGYIALDLTMPTTTSKETPQSWAVGRTPVPSG